MKSLQLKIALWFTVSVILVMGVFVGVTFVQLRHELLHERREGDIHRTSSWSIHERYSETEVNDIVGELWSLSLGYAIPVALIALGSGYLIAQRAFRPVSAMAQNLRKIHANNLTHRLETKCLDQEFQDIAANINNLLQRLEVSFQQLGDFSAQVAHELRTPLTLIRLQIEEAADRIDPAMGELMQEELRRLSNYVDQCLTLATAEQGRLEVQNIGFSLDEILQDITESYQRLAREENRSLELKTCPAPILGDPALTRQLLHTLLSNSLKHGTGGIRVELSDITTDEWCCEIVNPISTVPQHGSGLGLRLARALVQSLGWTMREETIMQENQFKISLLIPRFRPGDNQSLRAVTSQSQG